MAPGEVGWETSGRGLARHGVPGAGSAPPRTPSELWEGRAFAVRPPFPLLYAHGYAPASLSPAAWLFRIGLQV